LRVTSKRVWDFEVAASCVLRQKREGGEKSGIVKTSLHQRKKGGIYSPQEKEEGIDPNHEGGKLSFLHLKGGGRQSERIFGSRKKRYNNNNLWGGETYFISSEEVMEKVDVGMVDEAGGKTACSVSWRRQTSDLLFVEKRGGSDSRPGGRREKKKSLKGEDTGETTLKMGRKNSTTTMGGKDRRILGERGKRGSLPFQRKKDKRNGNAKRNFI